MEQEQAPAVQNKGLLITALVLGVLVVLLYNWHIGQVREAGIGETVTLLAPKRTLEPGEKLGGRSGRTPKPRHVDAGSDRSNPDIVSVHLEDHVGDHQPRQHRQSSDPEQAPTVFGFDRGRSNGRPDQTGPADHQQPSGPTDARLPGGSMDQRLG